MHATQGKLANMSYKYVLFQTLRVTVDLIMRVNPFTGMTVYIKTYTEK